MKFPPCLASKSPRDPLSGSLGQALCREAEVVLAALTETEMRCLIENAILLFEHSRMHRLDSLSTVDENVMGL